VQSLNLLLKAKDILFSSTPIPASEADRVAALPDVTDDETEAPEWAQRLYVVDRRFCADPDQLTERIERFAERHGLYSEP
jgi:hypothetical protein